MRRESLHDLVGNPLAGLARILADHSARFWVVPDQVVTESSSDHVSTFRRKRKLSRYATNAISSEKLSLLTHFIFASARAGSAGGLFHNNGYVDGSRVDYLDQGVRDIDIRAEGLAAHHTGGVDRVGGGGFHRLHTHARSDYGYNRRIGHHISDAKARSKTSCHPRPDFDLACHARVKT